MTWVAALTLLSLMLVNTSKSSRVMPFNRFVPSQCRTSPQPLKSAIAPALFVRTHKTGFVDNNSDFAPIERRILRSHVFMALPQSSRFLHTDLEL
jgi:hypothetical protein